jgi:pilus assembly protein Flp/PilA
MNLVTRQGSRVAKVALESGVWGRSVPRRMVGDYQPVGVRGILHGSQKEYEMNSMISKVRQFIVSEDGPTAVEYAVMLGLIVVAIAAVVGKLASSVSGTFSTVSSTLS